MKRRGAIFVVDGVRERDTHTCGKSAAAGFTCPRFFVFLLRSIGSARLVA